MTIKVPFCLIPETEYFAYGRQDEMLVCSCNFITDKEIVDVINSLLDEDCWQLIIIRATEEYHARRDSTGDEIFDFMIRLKQFHEDNRRADLERRQKSHRAA